MERTPSHARAGLPLFSPRSKEFIVARHQKKLIDKCKCRTTSNASQTVGQSIEKDTRQSPRRAPCVSSKELRPFPSQVCSLFVLVISIFRMGCALRAVQPFDMPQPPSHFSLLELLLRHLLLLRSLEFHRTVIFTLCSTADRRSIRGRSRARSRRGGSSRRSKT